MKVSAVGMPLSFNGQLESNYKREVEKKSDTAVKYTLGTAIAGACLLSVYYLNRGKKIKGINTKNFQSTAASTQIKDDIKPKLKVIKDIIDKTSDEVLKKLAPETIDTINSLKANSKDFAERLIKLLDNGKTKIEYIGKKGSKISKKHFYVSKNGELQGSITKLNNGTSILEKFKHRENSNIHKKIFLNKDGFQFKTQNIETKLQTSSGIPTGYTRIIEISEKGKPPIIRTTQLSLDMKPLSTKSNGKEIIYGYSSSKPDTIIGHAFSEGNKYVLKYLNNPKFKKYFDNIESIHTWAKENFTSR